jgi:hypothetical protein
MRLDPLLPTIALVLAGAVTTAQIGVAIAQTVAQIQTPAPGTPVPVSPEVAKQEPVGAVRSEEHARDIVRRAGYSDIGPLTQGEGGAWVGSAMRDGGMRQVKVDAEGKVTP